MAAKSSDNEFVLTPQVPVRAAVLEATGLGAIAENWHGDDLPYTTGGPPTGYVNKPGYKEWIKGVHAPGHFSFGPYYVPSGVGSLSQIFFCCDHSNRGNADDDIATFDCVDYNQGGANLVNPLTVKVRDLPSNSWGFVVYLQGNGIEINPKMKIETRIFAHGGANIRFFKLHWTVNYI